LWLLSNAAKVSNKLMEMFEQLAGKPTKETYEQATAMVSMANSIVNVQMAQIKFYRLSKLWIISNCSDFLDSRLKILKNIAKSLRFVFY
jgi:uncharacterized lipoprotein YehR (DUF1307 family)